MSKQYLGRDFSGGDGADTDRITPGMVDSLAEVSRKQRASTATVIILKEILRSRGLYVCYFKRKEREKECLRQYFFLSFADDLLARQIVLGKAKVRFDVLGVVYDSVGSPLAPNTHLTLFLPRSGPCRCA